MLTNVLHNIWVLLRLYRDLIIKLNSHYISMVPHGGSSTEWEFIAQREGDFTARWREGEVVEI